LAQTIGVEHLSRSGVGTACKIKPDTGLSFGPRYGCTGTANAVATRVIESKLADFSWQEDKIAGRDGE
jgi:hypothetical protein